ncbi:hypothetical protein, partial [Pseudomonas fluorescens]|uniref:hypothetical protein n=1 Tax=Pseudomonas fluorescens TaxID=294 RepID=UPI002B1DE018
MTTFEGAAEILRDFVKQRIHNNPSLHRRLMRIAQKISNYFVDNNFTTLKSLLTLTAWNSALLDAG